MNMRACAYTSLQPSITLQGLKPAPVAEFGGSGGFGGFFRSFSYSFLMKGNYQKSLQPSKVSNFLALARVSGQRGFWKVGGLQLSGLVAQMVQPPGFGSSLTFPHCGAKDREIPLGAEFSRWFIRWSIVEIIS